MAQLVKRLTSAQVMISQSVSSSPESGSGLTAQSLQPASDSVSHSLSASSPLMLSLSLSKINKHKKNFLKRKRPSKNYGIILKHLLYAELESLDIRETMG